MRLKKIKKNKTAVTDDCGGRRGLLMTSSTASRQSADQLGATKSPDHNPLCLAPCASTTNYTPVNLSCNDHIRFALSFLRISYRFSTPACWSTRWAQCLSSCMRFGTREAKFSPCPCGTCAGLPGRKSTCVHKEGRKPILWGPDNNTTTVKTIRAARTAAPECCARTKQASNSCS